MGWEGRRDHRDGPESSLTATRVLLCDEQPLFLLGLRSFLENQTDIQVVAETQDPESLLYYASLTHPSIVILSMAIATQEGFQIIRHLRDIHPEARVILTIIRISSAELVEAVQSGVMGYILKEADPSLYLRAIVTLREGRPWIQRELAEELLHAVNELTQTPRPFVPPVEELSYREREVLRLVAQGLSNREIADRLHLSVQTVKVYLTRIFHKLGVRNRTEATQQFLTYMVSNRDGKVS